MSALRFTEDSAPTHRATNPTAAAPVTSRWWTFAVALFVLACVVLGTWGRVYLIKHDILTLTRLCLPDDTYYYYQIARNIAAGMGSTFDGLAPTNGYHPLWMAALVGLFSVFKTGDDAIYASLILSSVLSLLTAWQISSILRLLGASRALGAVVGGLYFVNVYTIFFSVNGLETAACAFCLALLLRQAVGPTPATPLAMAGFGVVVGLAFLARTDMALLALPVALKLFFDTTPTRRLRLAIVSGATALLVVSPWLLWNWRTFGEIVQVSGKALAVYAYRSWALTNPGVGIYDAAFAAEMSRRWSEALIKWGFHLGGTPVVWELWKDANKITLGALVAVYAAFALSFLTVSTRLRAVQRLWPFLLFLPAYAVVHELVRWSGREWYPANAAPGFFVAVGALVHALISRGTAPAPAPIRPPARRTNFVKQALVTAFCLAAIAYTALSVRSFYDLRHRGFYSTQAIGTRDITLCSRLYAHGVLIGSTDAGIMGYFARDQRIVNLDGLVNNNAFRATREGRMIDYIRSVPLDAFGIRNDLQHEAFMGKDWHQHVISVGPLFELRARPAPMAPNMVWRGDARLPQEERYFLEGWLPGWYDGRWNDSTTTATIAFEIPADVLRDAPTTGTAEIAATPLQLTLVGTRFPPIADGMAATVTLADGTSITQTMGDVFTEYPLPRASITAGLNRATITFSRSARPANFSPTNRDIRKLSWRAQRLYIEKRP